MRAPFSYAGARERAAIPDPHFVLTPAAHAYLEARLPSNDPPLIDVAALSPKAPAARPRTLAHHARRAAWAGMSLAVAFGGFAFCAACIMLAVYLAVRHR